MVFQQYKMKYQGAHRFDGIFTTNYTYGSSSIVSSIQDGVHTVSIASHRTKDELPYEVKCEILRFLGINLDLPVEESFVEHPFDSSLGPTHYFSQKMEDSVFGEKQFLEDIKKDTDEIPDSLYLAVSLQAMGNGMTREQYVAQLRAILDAAFSTDDSSIPEDSWVQDHIDLIRKTFKRKPPLWLYFTWMLKQSEAEDQPDLE